jgi:hypothetical protein
MDSPVIDPHLAQYKYSPYIHIVQMVLGTFAKLRIATTNFVMSIRMEQLGSHWMEFHKISYFSVFRKSVKKTKVLLENYESEGYFT